MQKEGESSSHIPMRVVLVRQIDLNPLYEINSGSAPVSIIPCLCHPSLYILHLVHIPFHVIQVLIYRVVYYTILFQIVFFQASA